MRFQLKFQSNFIEIKFWHGCSPVNLMHIFRTPFPKNTYGRLLLIQFSSSINYLVYCSCFDTWTASSSVLRETNNCFITNEISKKWIINLLRACLINSKNIPINAKNHFHNSKLKKTQPHIFAIWLDFHKGVQPTIVFNFFFFQLNN